MKSYEYEEVSYEAKGMVFSHTEAHREIIDKYVKNGYRFVGFIPTEVGAGGCWRKIDLIFEKDE